MKKAIKYTKKAEKQLKKAQRNLGRAQILGLVDSLGGKMPIDLAKNFFFDRAKTSYHKSNQYLGRTRLELHDVGLRDNPLKMNFLLGFLDLFSQDSLTDWMVLSQIGRAKKRVKERRKELKSARQALEKILPDA